MDVYNVTFFKSTYLRTEGSSAFDLKVLKTFGFAEMCCPRVDNEAISRLFLVLAEEFC